MNIYVEIKLLRKKIIEFESLINSLGFNQKNRKKSNEAKMKLHTLNKKLKLLINKVELIEQMSFMFGSPY